jgi:hypothetical protein
MANRNIHTTYNSEAKSWRNISAGASRPIRTYSTKQQAQDAGRAAAQNRRVEHLIHKQDGQIGERNSYGHDPRKSRG